MCEDHSHRQDGVEGGHAAHDAGAERKSETEPEDHNRRRARAWILLQRADEPKQQQDHRNRERGILRVDEHVSVEHRRRRQQRERYQACDRTAEPASKPPNDGHAENADRCADKAPGLEQIIRQDLCGQRGQHVEAAAVHIQIDEGEGASIRKTGRIIVQQQLAILRMGVVVPSEAVIGESQVADDSEHCEQYPRGCIATTCNRIP